MRRIAFALVLGCSSSSSSSTQPPSDAGIDATLPATDDDWSCVGNVVDPVPTTPTVAYRFGAFDTTASSPIAGISVRVCPNGTDATCAGGTGYVTTEASGFALFDIPTRGVAYVETAEPGELTVLHYVPIPVVRATFTDGRIHWHGNELRVMLETANITPDFASHGHILAQAHDCRSQSYGERNDTEDNARAGNVRFSLEPKPAEAVEGYIEFVPRARITTTTLRTPDGLGSGGFVNVTPGVYTIIATRVDTGERVASLPIQVRANAITQLVLPPTPSP